MKSSMNRVKECASGHNYISSYPQLLPSSPPFSASFPFPVCGGDWFLFCFAFLEHSHDLGFVILVLHNFSMLATISSLYSFGMNQASCMLTKHSPNWAALPACLPIPFFHPPPFWQHSHCRLRWFQNRGSSLALFLHLKSNRHDPQFSSDHDFSPILRLLNSFLM